MKKAGVAIRTVATASILTILTLACGTTAPATPPPFGRAAARRRGAERDAAAVAETPAPAPPEPFRGIDPADLDPSVPACVDLNQFRNGGWLNSNPIPPDQSYWGSVSILFEQNRDRLRGILEKAAANPAAAGSDERKIGDFWASCMDEAAIEAAGAAPIQPELVADRPDRHARRSPGRDRATPGPRRQRGLPVHGGAGPPDLDRGHRVRGAGRPRPARPRLLPEGGRRVEDAAREVPGARRAHVRAARRRRPPGPPPTRRP